MRRLLKVFKAYPSVKGSLKDKIPDAYYCGNIAMTLKGISSVVPARQNAAVAAGVCPDLVEAIQNHLDERETCLRCAQCVTAIAKKNVDAQDAFKKAGGEKALKACIDKYGATTADFQSCYVALDPEI